MNEARDKYINTLSLPADLRGLSSAELKTVADELRSELIDSVATSGGHFASSLGATELTVALHHAFDTPSDRLVWDVGHQCYIHKMLTGRREQLTTIRKKDGLSGFLKRDESEYDTFGAGHAGTSISAAVGMATASMNRYPDVMDRPYTVAVIGDGSITAGMALEAMNHAGDLSLKRFIVVLNDNGMSISTNVGAMSWLFSRTVTSELSTRARKQFKSLHQKGYIPEIVYKAIDRAEEATQSWISSAAMLFESFGFRYIGPVDGHNLEDTIQALQNAKTQDVPVLVHVRTQKGFGFKPSEEDPIKWHGVKPFSRDKGEFIPSPPAEAPSYTDIFSDALVRQAEKDQRIIGITAAMAGGTGLDKFQKAFPSRFFDVGICEQHAVTFAAGLASEGMKPVCAIYSTFLQRGYDQVLHDVCIQNLPVVFALDRGGLVGNDGETHQGVFDISYLRLIPNLVLMAPSDENELQHMLYTALQLDGPSALRYPRGNAEGIETDKEPRLLEIGRGRKVQSGEDVLFVCYGTTLHTAKKVAEQIKQRTGKTCSIIDARFAKPLDEELFTKEFPRYNLVCCIEDHTLTGGFSSAVLEFVNDTGLSLKQPVLRFGVQDDFVSHASQEEQKQINGFDEAGILATLLPVLSENRVVGY